MQESKRDPLTSFGGIYLDYNFIDAVTQAIAEIGGNNSVNVDNTKGIKAHFELDPEKAKDILKRAEELQKQGPNITNIRF